jgi:hypothetical protein
MGKGDFVLDPERNGELPDVGDLLDEEDIPLRPERSTYKRGPGRPRRELSIGPDAQPPVDWNPRPRIEEVEMGRKDDLAQQVGKDMMSSFKAAAKEVAAQQFDTSVSPLASVANTISARTVGDLASQFPTINMRIRRKNPSTMRWDIIPAPKGVDPKAIADPGALEDLVLNWSGGGEYEIELGAPGTKGFVPVQFTIDAPSVPVPQYRNQGLPNAFSGMPPVSHEMGISRYLQQQQGPQQQTEGGLLKLVEQMLAMQLAQNMNPRQQEPQQNREVEDLKRQLLETQNMMRLNEERSRTDRERAEMLQRMDELSRKMDAQAAARPDPMTTMITTLAPAFLAKGDSAAQTMATMMQAVMQQQQSSSGTTLELFKAMNSKPEVEERFASLVSTMGNMSANTMAMVSQVMQSGLLDKGGDSPVAQIISQVIGEAADVAKVIFANAGGAQEQPVEAQSQQLPSLPPPSAQPLPVGDGAFGALPAHIERHLTVEDETEETEETEAEAEAEDDNTYDLMKDGAFREILTRIRENGDVKDIAVRLYRHGKSHPVAKAWFNDPQVAGKGIMEQLGIEPARSTQIVEAVEALTQYLAAGGDPATYGPPVARRAREQRRIPATHATSASLGEHYDPDTITRVATNPPPPLEETAQPEVVEVQPEAGPLPSGPVMEG